MRPLRPLRNFLTRMLVTLLTWTFVFGQTQPVLAQLTPLSDIPIAAKVSAKPNIVYTLDDSGSMQYNYLPDFVISAQTPIAITSITSAGTTATVTVASTVDLTTGDYVSISGAAPGGYNGFVQITVISATQFTYTVVAGLASPATGTKTYAVGNAYCRSGNYTTPCQISTQQNNNFTTNVGAPPYLAADFNRLAYNPAVIYQAPLQANGAPFTRLPDTDANGNYGTTAALYNSASVHRDPYWAMFGSGTKDNLNTKVNVPLYCNTDWPLTAGGAASNLALNPDVANANGQYLPTSGAWCRINGTAYDLSAASGALAVVADYNYPWQPSAGAAGPDHFRIQIANKILHCDFSSPYWPRNNTVITGCTGTPTTTGGTPVQQRCNRNGFQCNPTVASRNFTPAACKPSTPGFLPASWCAPNIGGSDGFSSGTGGVPECASCTCNNDFQPNTGNCSITGAFCNAGYGVFGGNLAQCPDQTSAVVITGCTGGTTTYQKATGLCTGINLAANQSSRLWDPATNAELVPTTTLLQDSNANGLVCRHNNLIYAVSGVPAAGGLATYPRINIGDVYAANKTGIAPYTQLGHFGAGGSGRTITAGCPTVGNTVAIPRHYYQIASVQFCDQKIGTPNVRWRGFGTGVCQANNDLGKHQYVQYGQFTRVDLFATNPVPFPNGRVWLAGASPSPANSESINYANWYAYYATRLNAAKTTSAIAFSFLTVPPTEPIAYRVGFHTLGNELPADGGSAAPIIYVNVNDWNLAQRTAWYNALFNIAVSNYKTPTLSAMMRIGNLFETGGAAGVPANVKPLPAGATDPLFDVPSSSLISCQNNFHILFTDGKTNQIALPTAVGDQDGTIPGFLTGVPPIPPDQVLPNLGLGGPWPRPFVQGTAVPNTLADIAARYWANDLRPGLINDVPAASGLAGGDIDPSKDVAWWQHVNFSAISFGAEGTLDAGNQAATISSITAGTLNWPNLTAPNNPIFPLGNAAGAVAVDDLWHATAMARGSFVFAKSPVEVSYGLASILAGIQNQRKARTGGAFNGQVLDATNNVVFLPTIEAGWAGDLIKVDIDPVTGVQGTTWWNARVTLANQISPAFFGDEPWMDETKRRIVTLTGATGPGVPFRLANLTAAQQASLAPNAVMQDKMVSYLRGGNTYTSVIPPVGTTVIEGTGIGQFRKRFGAPPASNLFGVLGDISNAQPVISGPPNRNYVDGTDPGYTGWKTSAPISGRQTAIVAPANDGMVHVFAAGPMPPGAIGPGGGNEIFAFVPKALFRGVAGNIMTEDVTAIQALTYQDGGIPIYHHHMYVDSSPRVADVDFSNGAGTDWRTIVVGGLGKGGNSYYALDLTNPTAATEAVAANKVLWEWSLPAEVKYTYGRPVIVKVRQAGYPTGRWVVIVTGGYNNVSGLGKVFFLDATNGTLLSTVTTTAGSAATPSGLAQTHAFVKDRTNQIAEQVYGGDLLGNLWRIDVSGVGQYLGASAVLFAQLTDPGGNPQPVTTAPQIEIDINNGIDRYVFIGTGRLLDQSDFTTPATPQTQTMYAMRDGSLNAVDTTTLPVTRSDLQPVNPDGVSAIVGGAPNGWYHDLPNIVGDSQRIVTDVQADVNIAFYIGTRVQDDPCLISLPANLYAKEYVTGRSLLLDSLGAITSTIYLPLGAVSATIVAGYKPDGSPTFKVMIYGEKNPGVTPFLLANPVTGVGNRLTWKLLGTE